MLHSVGCHWPELAIAVGVVLAYCIYVADLHIRERLARLDWEKRQQEIASLRETLAQIQSSHRPEAWW